MLTHGGAELLTLAADCDLEELVDSNGWVVDLWRMSDEDADRAIAAYRALLLGDVPDPVAALLDREGIDLAGLLLDAKAETHKITRSDVTELTAAATLIAANDCHPKNMHMPNVPKMSRRKSDSGVDVFDVKLDGADPEDLTDDDHLTIASVKHTIKSTSSGLRWSLEKSLTDELTPAYLARQLRVLDGRLRQEGVPSEASARVFMFLRGFPDSDVVTLVGVGVMTPDVEGDIRQQVESLVEVDEGAYTFRIVLFPELPTLHERCP